MGGISQSSYPLTTQGHYEKIHINKIKIIDWLPSRTQFGDIVSLAKSIKERGDVEVPIKVRKCDDGFYELVWGRRRLEAAKIAGLTEISCIVEVLDDKDIFLKNTLENLHRKDKNVIEEAELFAVWKQKFGLSYESLSESLGIDKKYIYNRISLLSLPEDLRNLIKNDPNNRFGVYHGLLLLKLKDRALQEKLGREVIEKNLTTRQLEARIREIENSLNSLHYDDIKHDRGSEPVYYDITLPLSTKITNPMFPRPKIIKCRRRKNLINIQILEIPSHFGTHIDLPQKFHKQAPSLQQMPLEKFMGHGAVLNTPKEENEPITLHDIRNNEVKIFENDIVFFYTGWAKRYGTKSYIRHPYLTTHLVYWLVQKKVKLIGIDTPTIETPYHLRGNRFDYPLHKILSSHNILVVESLGDMAMLAGKRAYIYALPVYFEGADSCLVKVIARLFQPITV